MAGYLPRENRNRSGERRPRAPARHHSLDRSHRPTHWQYSCGLCQEDHSLKTCRRFLKLSPYQRYETVERRGYCRNCLARSHLAPDCTSLTGCRRCHSRHHTELHGAPQFDGNSQQAISSSSPFRMSSVFVSTAMVRVSDDEFDTWKIMRAILCQSLPVSRFASSTFKRLGLRSFKRQGHRFTTFNIKARQQSKSWTLKVTALITEELPRRPYSDPIIQDPTRDFNPDTMADIDPRGNTPIDLELGADVYAQISQDGSMATSIGDVMAFRTRLGYVFIGAAEPLF